MVIYLKEIFYLGKIYLAIILIDIISNKCSLIILGLKFNNPTGYVKRVQIYSKVP